MQVFLATWNETLVAVKVLLSADDAAAKSNGSSISLPPSVVDELHKEAGLMASLRHPNVVLFLGVCSSPPAVVTGERNQAIDMPACPPACRNMLISGTRLPVLCQARHCAFLVALVAVRSIM